VCGRRVTIGVMHRVEELADREEGYVPEGVISFKHLIPLEEIISEAIGKGVGTVAVESEYKRIIQHFGSEFRVLLDLEEEELREFVPQKILKGIMKVRRGEVDIQPGYDGEYGKISIFRNEEEGGEQLSLF
jgi:PHP family Zn ribbon phosphoesterase